MPGKRAVEILRAFDTAGTWYAVDGGWGVDALLGEQTREHGDLDLAVPLDEIDQVLRLLADLGFGLTLDERPKRLMVRHRDGAEVDLHPLRFDEKGDGWQIGAGANGGDAAYPPGEMTKGTIAGKSVRCLGAELQLRHHAGYDPGGVDRHDVGKLVERFGLEAPPKYR